LPVFQKLKSLGHRIWFHAGLSAAMAKRQACARILMYHGTTGAGAHALAAQLRYLARNFKIVSLAAMVEQLGRYGAAAPNEIVLTFDDGLRNNFTVVYPMLRELQVPATFFVCPELVDSGRWLWNHEIRCRLQILDHEALAEVRSRIMAANGSVEGIIEWIKTLKPPQRRWAEEMVRHATPDFQPTPAQSEAYDMMSWNDLAALDPALVTIGSHTLTHPILTTLTAEEIDFELRQSRRILEQKLGREIHFFCYPNGSYDERVYQAVKNNYCAAVTTEIGVLSGKIAAEIDLHRLPRIPSAENPALTAWRLHRPEA
jgi:peptidoglycan/xylan/chitin deacetylase (PgdA/CDA1 family)